MPILTVRNKRSEQRSKRGGNTALASVPVKWRVQKVPALQCPTCRKNSEQRAKKQTPYTPPWAVLRMPWSCSSVWTVFSYASWGAWRWTNMRDRDDAQYLQWYVNDPRDKTMWELETHLTTCKVGESNYTNFITLGAWCKWYCDHDTIMQTFWYTLEYNWKHIVNANMVSCGQLALHQSSSMRVWSHDTIKHKFYKDNMSQRYDRW